MSGEQPVGVHQPLPLHLHLAPHLGVVAPHVVKQHLGLVSHVDLHGLPGALHPAGHVHGVPEETVPAVQYSTVQYSKYNTVQYSTIQYNIVQYNTVQ